MSAALRKTAGAIMLLGFFSCSAGMTALKRMEYRIKSGDDETEPALAVIRAHVESSYAKNGTLCGTSIAEDEQPLTGVVDEQYLSRTTREELAAERERHVGFSCLEIGPNDILSGQNAYWYASDGTHFSVRAFRAELYDPNGVLAQWELHGEVVDGRLAVDSHIDRLPGGGPAFPGHPQSREYE